MNSALNEFLSNGVFAFILVFVRIGAAATIMPGIGDSLTPTRVRLYIALGLSLVLTPAVQQYLPSPIPPVGTLAVLIGMEFIIGMFIGTVARILITALDTAGMIISMQTGLGNAQLFNPALSSQGSLIGTVLSITGVVLIFASGLYKLLFMGMVGSYQLFPVGHIPDSGSMAEMISGAIASSFLIGVQISAPFLVIGLMLYIGMGVLSRLMPQLQVFMIAVPLQILLLLSLLATLLPIMMMFWMGKFEDGMVYFLSSSGG